MFDNFLENLGGRSIKRKLIVISIMISSITILAAGGTMLGIEIFDTRDNLVKTISLTAEIIGNQSAAAIEFQDKSAAEENLQAARTSSSIEMICLYNEVGNEFANYIPREEKTGNLHGEVRECPDVEKANVNTDCLLISPPRWPVDISEELKQKDCLDLIVPLRRLNTSRRQNAA